jgi:protein involved in polysaccharide export with SLBB domain
MTENPRPCGFGELPSINSAYPAGRPYFLCLAAVSLPRYFAQRAKLLSKNDAKRAERAMKLFVSWTRVVAVSIFLLQFCVATFGQEAGIRQDLGASVQSSQTGGTGAGVSRMVASQPVQTDGVGNLQLGGRRPLYRLNRSDVVELSFTLSPEFDQILIIQPDGYVTLKDAGTVLAQGLTLDEFRSSVERAYTGYLHAPQVAVALKEFEHPYFIAGGEVGKPGKYELHTETNIMEAVQIAGGFTHVAKHSQVVLFRRVNDDVVEARLFDMKKMFKEKRLGEVPELRPGDLVFVPQNSISKIERFITKPGFGIYMSPAQF